MRNAVRRLEKAETYLNADNHRELKDRFLENYTKCEVLCRPIIKEYLKSTGEYTNDEEIGMELQTIKDALLDASCYFEDIKLLTRIWGKEQGKGFSSCRFLRNKITHELMERALHEVVERNQALNTDMEEFIAIIKELY